MNPSRKNRFTQAMPPVLWLDHSWHPDFIAAHAAQLFPGLPRAQGLPFVEFVRKDQVSMPRLPLQSAPLSPVRSQRKGSPAVTVRRRAARAMTSLTKAGGLATSALTLIRTLSVTGALATRLHTVVLFSPAAYEN